MRALYGEYTGFEGMHKLWELTARRRPATDSLSAVWIVRRRRRCSIPKTFHSHGPTDGHVHDVAAYDMSGGDPKWLEVGKRFLSIVLAAP